MEFDCPEWIRGNRLRFAAVFLIASVLIYRFSILSLLIVVSASLLGYCFASLLTSYGAETIYWDIAQRLLQRHPVEKVKLVRKLNDESFEKRFRNGPPWRGLVLSESINEALEELIEQILDNYVNSWYKNDINGDAAFLNEIRYQIRYVSAQLLQKILQMDLSSTILSEAVPVAVVHCERVVRVERKIDNKMLTPQMVETEILENLDNVHYALTGRQNEANYLRQLADHLINSFVDESRVAGHSSDNDSPFLVTTNGRQWPSRACQHFLRELIVYSFLLPLLDLIADPDTINRLLIILFDPLPMSQVQAEESMLVPFLHGLTDSNAGDASDSLLQLKLSEVLRDMRNLQMFSLYLKDVRGPVNELYFLLHCGDVHERMLSVQKNDDNALSELHYDTWEIYRKYLHEGARHPVSLPNDVLSDFQKAVEEKDVEVLDRTLEKAFQLVYRRLQRDYLVPFCQSDCYFGHLCGSPPVSVDDLIAAERKSDLEDQSSLLIPDSTFSLSQFRRRLWKVIMPPATDGSIEPLDQLGDGGITQVSSASVIELANDASSLTPRNASSSSDIPGDLTSFDKISIETFGDDDTDNGICVVRSSPAPSLGSSSEKQLFAASACDLVIFDLERDINRWIVTIPHIESRREPSTGKNVFVYVVCIERFDLNDTPVSSRDGPSKSETRLNKWSVIRRYNEFYVLESKLVEFHGVLLKTEPLPPRRPFSRKSREFIEAHRVPFQRFLDYLTKQVLLRRSDLLFAFLTSDQEFKDNIQLSGLNPWNMVRKMPSKFTRERGQNLKPFLLSLLANTLAPQTTENTADARVSRCGEAFETSGLSPSDLDGVCRPRLLMINSIYGDNCPKAKADLSDENGYEIWTRSVGESLLFLLSEVFAGARWLFTVLTSCWSFAGSSLDLCTTFLLQRVLDVALIDSNCVRMIRLIQEALFTGESSPVSEQEKVLRVELALRRSLEYLETELPPHLVTAVGTVKFRSGVRNIFHSLQYPRLNKQLSYVLLDILVQKLAPIKEM